MTQWVKVKKIQSVGRSNTYDIWNKEDNCYFGEGNFVLNGSVVHNSIPTAVANRDDDTLNWKNKLSDIDPILLEILEDTYGVIVWQEQLASIWQRIGGFTAPEAQSARKAVAKKWTHKLKPIREKWLVGASKTIGEKNAVEYWSLMETFGRYAFNKSHGVSYCLVALRCLWLKAHFAPEWWAAVMSDCNPKKLVRYMGIARGEGWKPTDITMLGKCENSEIVKSVEFDTINVNNLSTTFTVTNNTVNQGLIGIKGIGDNAAEQFSGITEFSDVDEFIEIKGGKNKSVMERFIKLGAFKHVPGHENSRALWHYYQYKYCSGKNITKLRNEIKQLILDRDGWDDDSIRNEIQRQIDEYKKAYPNRRKVPPKLLNWRPKPDDSRESIMSLYEGDFTTEEILAFEKEYLGYYIHSPLSIFDIQGNYTIANAKEVAQDGGDIKIEAVVTDIQFAKTKTDKDYCRLSISDGIQTALLLIWSNELGNQRAECLTPGAGVQMFVEFDPKRNIFTLPRNEMIINLLPRDWNSNK